VIIQISNHFLAPLLGYFGVQVSLL
jgi:hypothetical protein